MAYIIIIIVSFGASVVGAICGIGGGVIIKPVLDAAGIIPVHTISFLSGCTVLSMSAIAVGKNLYRGNEIAFDKKMGSLLAFGAAAGGAFNYHAGDVDLYFEEGQSKNQPGEK